MLIRYKKNLEKMAMGLLAFMPEEKNVKTLQETMNEYETNDNWHLYLWREDSIIGAIGVRIENELDAVVQHISVNPSHRNLGIGKRMVDEVTRKYEKEYVVCPNEATEAFFNKCSEQSTEEDSSEEE
ncbi:MAG TPA: GNAT family N-acetyltransferase [Bacillota bacterium]|nr:GNAT family N-acetyltransferase [Bacillota bacterium]